MRSMPLLPSPVASRPKLLLHFFVEPSMGTCYVLLLSVAENSDQLKLLVAGPPTPVPICDWDNATLWSRAGRGPTFAMEELEIGRHW